MTSALVLVKAISLAAKQEAHEHKRVVLEEIEQDLQSLKPLTQNLEASLSQAYTHQITVLEEVIKKKKDDL